MKDLGELRYFLGVEVDRQDEKMSLTQHKYTLDLLAKAGMTDCKPLPTPSVVNQKLSICDGELYPDAVKYRSLVGMLQYLTFTRPDIVYSVNQVSQFMHEPKTGHMDAVKRILRYLKGTVGDGLIYIQSSWKHQNMTYWPIQMQTGQGIQMRGGLFQDTVFSLGEILSHGVAENRRLWQDLAQRQSIDLWQLPQQK